MTSPITIQLAPFADPGDRPARGAALSVVPLGSGMFQIGCAIPGHGDMRGGVVTMAQLMNFCREITRNISQDALREWREIEAFTANGQEVRRG